MCSHDLHFSRQQNKYNGTCVLLGRMHRTNEKAWRGSLAHTALPRKRRLKLKPSSSRHRVPFLRLAKTKNVYCKHKKPDVLRQYVRACSKSAREMRCTSKNSKACVQTTKGLVAQREFATPYGSFLKATPGAHEARKPSRIKPQNQSID